MSEQLATTSMWPGKMVLVPGSLAAHLGSVCGIWNAASTPLGLANLIQ